MLTSSTGGSHAKADIKSGGTINKLKRRIHPGTRCIELQPFETNPIQQIPSITRILITEYPPRLQNSRIRYVVSWRELFQTSAESFHYFSEPGVLKPLADSKHVVFFRQPRHALHEFDSLRFQFLFNNDF